MTHSSLVAATALAALVVGGCASLPGRQAESADVGTFARIEPGSSQLSDVTAIAGEPVYVVPAYNIAVYEDEPKPARLPFGCGLNYRFVCGASNDRPKFYVVQYSESDVVQRAEGMVGDLSYSEVVKWAGRD